MYNEITAAKKLMELDAYLRENISDETIFESWLMCGVPDGTESYEELLPLEEEEYEEMVALADRLIARDNGEEDYEPDDIDDDMGYDPYEGCCTWDC